MATAALGHAFAWLQLKSSRAFDLRQAVYLEAAVAMANSLRFFDRVLQLSVEDHSLSDDIHPISLAMFKIHVCGTPATIAALSSANHCLTVAALELTKKRAVLRSAVAEASHTDDVEAHREVDRLQRDLAAETMRASLLYQRTLVEMNVSVRRELGLPLDEAQYRASNLQAEQRIAAAIEQTIQSGTSPTTSA